MPRDQTILHGDFHKGNLFVRPEEEGPTDPSEVIVIDWAYFGLGHVSWEINYYLLLGADNQQTLEEEVALCKAYHEELLKVNPKITYTLGAIRTSSFGSRFGSRFQSSSGVIEQAEKLRRAPFFGHVLTRVLTHELAQVLAQVLTHVLWLTFTFASDELLADVKLTMFMQVRS